MLLFYCLVTNFQKGTERSLYSIWSKVSDAVAAKGIQDSLLGKPKKKQDRNLVQNVELILMPVLENLLFTQRLTLAGHPIGKIKAPFCIVQLYSHGVFEGSSAVHFNFSKVGWPLPVSLFLRNSLFRRNRPAGGVVIDRMKIWLVSPPNLILGDILRTLAFSEFFLMKKSPCLGEIKFLIYNGKSIFLLL